MKQINVITVCGSGTVSSAMVGQRIKEMLEEEGFDAKITEINPGMLENTVASAGKIDLIANTCPIDTDLAGSIPVINAVGVLTGMDEETFLEAALAALQ